MNRFLPRLVSLLACVLAASSAIAADPPATQAVNKVKLIDLFNDPLLAKTIYVHYQADTQHLIGFAPSGAVGSSVSLEKGEKKDWFIEHQRYGGDLVQFGIALQDRQMVRQGWKIIQWGLDHSAADGSYPGTGDEFHSTSLFIEAASRAALDMIQSGNAEYVALAKAGAPRIVSSARYLITPPMAERGARNDAPYTHRRYILAAALGQSAELVASGPDANLAKAAEAYARQGIALQRPDGVNPEKAGFDASYQVVGLGFAAQYSTLCRDESLRHQLLNMIRAGAGWELTRIDEAGNVSLVGSTRAGIEPARSGKTKTVDYKAVIEALAYAARLTGDPKIHNAAERVAAAHGWGEKAPATLP